MKAPSREEFNDAMAVIAHAMRSAIVVKLLRHNGHTQTAIDNALALACSGGPDNLALMLPGVGKVLALAVLIANHWRQQEGVNATYLDQLEEATR